jgi:hypothetical protein
MFVIRDELVRQTLELSRRIQSEGRLKEGPVSVGDAFLRQASHSPDNLRAAECVEFGESENRDFGPSRKVGLKVRGKPFLVSDVAWELECDEVFEFLARRFPDLTRQELEACLRVCTTVLLGLECRWSESGNSEDPRK